MAGRQGGRWVARLGSGLLCVLLLAGTSLAAGPEAALRDRLAAAAQPTLAAFYAERGYRPVWTDVGGVAAPGRRLAAALAASGHPAPAGTDPAATELLLSGALLQLAAGLADVDAPAGAVDTTGLALLRRAALAAATEPAGGPALAAFLGSELPDDPGYWRLRAAVERYARLQPADWPAIADGPPLVPGDEDERVLALRQRLAAEDAPELALPLALFDPALEAAVRRFQLRHGLAVDGAVGPLTRRALNRTVAARLATLRANRERLRRPLADRPERYLLVNIAAAELAEVVDGQVGFESPVIVGRSDWPTPELESAITAIDLNPAWHVPPSIVAAELGPRLKRDPGYLGRQHIRVFEGGGELSPAEVAARSSLGGLRFRQDPGGQNPLGPLKFVFANPYGVYLHGSPAVGLFRRAERALSHGCVRVERALELAQRLLAGDPAWTPAALAAALASGATRTVPLRVPMPILLVYLTAWVDADGTVQFRDDLYGRDPPTPPPA
ncbi:MAG: L,D-transpeptidase family protein [Dongiaceae bacterium]